MRASLRLVPMVCVVFTLAYTTRNAPVDRGIVQSNDNRTPAGKLTGDTLHLRLTLQMATWRPEADSGPAIEVAAFAEDGKAPQIPAPLIRVTTGTIITATVRNALIDSTITLHGLVTHPGRVLDSLRLRPGDSATVTFAAGAPGTYLYAAETGVYGKRGVDERETTGGAFVIDPVGGAPPDRIFVMNIWGHEVDSTTYRNALTINGRSWPFTERIDATVGDSVRWRVINATGRGHPMHMHGFYFRVDSRGGMTADSTYEPASRRMAVTEFMPAFETMAITWSPDREGNWLFHCHIGFHVTRDATLTPPAISDAHARMDHDPEKHMAGLVIGMRVVPRPGAGTPAVQPARTLHLFVNQGRSPGRADVGMGYVLQQGASPPAADSVVLPGTVIVVTRGQPTDVVITNRLKETTAVHWHGLELESYSDGVAGWSGSGKRLAPVIQPGDSFIAHLTLKRAGTFIYHTHMDDLLQMTSGLYGAVVVLEPGQHWDPATDHVWVAGDDGLNSEKHRIVMNGDTTGPILEFRAGVRQRMRFVNIGFALGAAVGVYRDSTLVPWRAIAKDGADLPAPQAVIRTKPQLTLSGETYDFEWVPTPGRYHVKLLQPKKVLFSQEVVVR